VPPQDQIAEAHLLYTAASPQAGVKARQAGLKISIPTCEGRAARSEGRKLPQGRGLPDAAAGPTPTLAAHARGLERPGVDQNLSAVKLPAQRLTPSQPMKAPWWCSTRSRAVAESVQGGQQVEIRDACRPPRSRPAGRESRSRDGDMLVQVVSVCSSIATTQSTGRRHHQ